MRRSGDASASSFHRLDFLRLGLDDDVWLKGYLTGLHLRRERPHA